MVSQLCLIEGFDIIRGMPVDYMHGVLLGIVKKMLAFWFDKKYKKEKYYIGTVLTNLALLTMVPENTYIWLLV